MTGSAPSARNASLLSAERVVPTMVCPTARNSGVSLRPIAPPAPARNIFIVCSIGDDELTTRRCWKLPRDAGGRHIELKCNGSIMTAQESVLAIGRKTEAHG